MRYTLMAIALPFSFPGHLRDGHDSSGVEPVDQAVAYGDSLLYLAITAACAAEETNVPEVAVAMALLHRELSSRAVVAAVRRSPWLREN